MDYKICEGKNDEKCIALKNLFVGLPMDEASPKLSALALV